MVGTYYQNLVRSFYARVHLILSHFACLWVRVQKQLQTMLNANHFKCDKAQIEGMGEVA
jgi:hypothetical protein